MSGASRERWMWTIDPLFLGYSHSEWEFMCETQEGDSDRIHSREYMVGMAVFRPGVQTGLEKQEL